MQKKTAHFVHDQLSTLHAPAIKLVLTWGSGAAAPENSYQRKSMFKNESGIIAGAAELK